MGILEKINAHADLVALDDQQRQLLCREIREFLVEHIAKTGGHLASNLGVVELTVALETVYDTSADRLVFDVGHQSYVHKLLTGRRADFDGLRQFGGMAGFPKPSESDTDAFVAGHASSSVSIALGMARARSLQKKDYHVVAVLGDGAATGGMAYEGLNDAAVSNEPMVIILNDNEMSIDRNVGGMASHLSRLRSKESYLGMKQRYKDFMSRIPGGGWIFRVTRSIKDWFKRVLIPTTIFENMGLTYLGPVDGHDLPGLISLLRTAKEMREPVLIHVLTQKGRGYKPAEDQPSRFHGIGKFDPDSGLALKKGDKTFSEAFGEKLCSLAQVDDRVCAVTAAMPGGTGLLGFKEQFPKRLFDVGIAEEHAVSMAGGLAKQGMVPVVALYSTFLQRAYDQIIQDVAMLKLHVVLAVDRAGLVGDDGETHHGVFDVGFLRQIPNMTILAPGSTAELQQMLEWAVEEQNGPVAIRYPRGADLCYQDSAWENREDILQNGALSIHRRGADAVLVTYGTMLQNALEAADLLREQNVEVTVLRLMTLSPLPVEQIRAIAEGKPVFVLEDSVGGIREALGWELRDHKVYGLDLGRAFATHGDNASLHRKYGLDGKSIAEYIQGVRKYEN